MAAQVSRRSGLDFHKYARTATESERQAQRNAERASSGKPLRKVTGAWLNDPSWPRWRIQSDNNLRSAE